MLDWTSRRPVTTSLRNAFCFWMISSFVSPIAVFARAMFAISSPRTPLRASIRTRFLSPQRRPSGHALAPS
jgi:hypothetical protein